MPIIDENTTMDLDDNINNATVYIEGIKERLEDLTDGSIYFLYGQLIAEGKVSYDKEFINDSTALTKLLIENNLFKKHTLDW